MFFNLSDIYHANTAGLLGAVGFMLLAMVVLVWIGKVPLGYNVRSLLVRWKTTLLTALAFTLVISLQTVMLAFVNGMAKLTEQSGQPGNVMVLSDGAIDELMSTLKYTDLSDVERQPGVLRDGDQPLCSREVYVVVNQPLPPVPKQASWWQGLWSWLSGDTAASSTATSNRRRFTQVRGIDDPLVAGRVHNIELLPGGLWFSAAGVRTPEGGDGEQELIEAVIGEGVAGQLGQDRGKEQIAVGEVFDLGPRKWVVTGIMKAAGSTFGSEIWAKRDIVGPLFGKANYTSLVLRTADASAAKLLAADLTTNFKKAALQAQTETEYFSKLGETNRQFLAAIIFVAIVMAAGGVLGVMNTMFAAISQRTKDIGVLRILGYKRWQVLVSFFVESLFIALIGGVIGCALGSLADGATATSIVSSNQGGGKFVVLELAVGLDTLLIGLLLALAMGAIGGLLPAWSTFRLRPLESLR